MAEPFDFEAEARDLFADAQKAHYRPECKAAISNIARVIRRAHAAGKEAGEREMRERSTSLVKETQETITDNQHGTFRHLTPRTKGNLTGLAFADGIAALPLTEDKP